MTYTTLAVLGVLGSVLLDLVIVRTRLLATRAFWLSYLIIVGFQLLVNGALTGYRIVTYDPQTILGLRVAFAPIEDLAFGFAMTGTTLMAWTWSDQRTRRATAAGTHEQPLEDDRDEKALHGQHTPPRERDELDPFPEE